MKHVFLKFFLEQLESYPIAVQKKFQKQLMFLLADIRHPSLHAKKYDESRAIWQARVDKDFRFYFLIEKDTYILIGIKKHPK